MPSPTFHHRPIPVMATFFRCCPELSSRAKGSEAGTLHCASLSPAHEARLDCGMPFSSPAGLTAKPRLWVFRCAHQPALRGAAPLTPGCASQFACIASTPIDGSRQDSDADSPTPRAVRCSRLRTPRSHAERRPKG
eukprot:1396388-Prymnesium_polylepis.2